MFSKIFAIILLAILAASAQSGIFDSLFEPVPYNSEAVAISDLKTILKYASQCQYASCKHPGLGGIPTKDPFPSCKSWRESEANFWKKYNISPEQIKTKHINWYLTKIREYDYAICD